MANPYLAGSVAQGTAGVTSIVAPISVATGSLDGIMVAQGNGGATPSAVSSVTDTKGNTYVQKENVATGAFINAYVAATPITPLTTSDSVTVHYSAATTGGANALVVGVPGVQKFDVGTTHTGSGTTATATQAPTNAGEVALAIFGWSNGGGSGSVSSPFTQVGQAHGGSSQWLTAAYDTAGGTGSLTPTATLTSTTWSAIVLFLQTTGVTHTGTTTLAGIGTLGPAVGAFAGTTGPSGMAGVGTLSGAAVVKPNVGAALSGVGTLFGASIGTLLETIPFSGIGTLSGSETGVKPQSGVFSGIGTLSTNVRLGFAAKLSGQGTLSLIGRGGVAFASPGVAPSYAEPGASQVSVAAQGSTNWQYLGTIGVMTALTYSYVCPGGADKMSCTIMVPATYRTQFFNPGWQVRITRGGHVIWNGKLDEPVPTTSGWNLTGVGTGNIGQDFLAIYTDVWPTNEPDESINAAISRGLPWVNPGVGTPAGAWYGQEVDSGAQTITALLNLICTRGGLTWYVNSQPGGVFGNDLNVFSLPNLGTGAVPNRTLVCTQPVPRTLGGDINTLFIRYTVSAAAGTTSTAYATTSVVNAQSVQQHGVLEDYVDLSSAGVMTAGQAQAVGNYVLSIYQRASFAGPFTASYGQLLNAGGSPIDPGTDQAGTVMRLILTDYGYGGEVVPAPIVFLVGSYSWDDFAQIATISPFQTLDTSLTGLLSVASSNLTPVSTIAS